MKDFIKKAKEIYETYKIIVWVIAVLAWGYDRTMNFWNVPTRLTNDENRFIETHKKDSIMFQDHLIFDSRKWAYYAQVQKMDSIKIRQLENKLKNK